MQISDLFVELSVVIVIATVIAGLMKLIKQPLIIGHIITGLVIGPHALNLISEPQSLEVFSKIGVSILLFIVGISLSPKVVRDVGRIALITGLGQIVFTTVFGFLISLALGFNIVESLYISIGLTFSSTIIVMKLVSDKKDLEKLYARISIGFLLVQDLVATIILIFVSTLSSAGNGPLLIMLTLFRGFALTVLLVLITLKVLPRIGNFFSNSQEYLFLFSVGWGFGLAALFKYIGLSMEIGALVAGVTLSATPYAQEVSAKMKPLRDFFIILFFIYLGSTLEIADIQNYAFISLIFSIFILLGNPIVVIILMGIMGYNKKTSFNAGLTVAQISEFSLILTLLGISLGHLNQEIMSLMTIIGIITIAGSSYMILYSDRLYPWFSKYLSIFEKKNPIKEDEHRNNYEVIIFGCNRVGYDFVKIFKNAGENFLAIDFDPEVISYLTKSGVNCIYGDAEDAEFLEEINIESARMIISTIPDFETNTFLIEKVRQKNANSVVITISYNINEALELYKIGATYVVLPHFISGQFASELAHKSKNDLNKLLARREEHISYLLERKSLGHEHPTQVHHY